MPKRPKTPDTLSPIAELLSQEYGHPLPSDETQEAARTLVGFFTLLDEIDRGSTEPGDQS